MNEPTGATALGIYGNRARIGYTSPPINTETYAYEFYKIAPPGVTTVLTTLMVAQHTDRSGELQESWSHSQRAARVMARAGVDLIVLGGTPVTSNDRSGNTLASLQEELGVPITTSTAAYRHANEVLGASVCGAVYYGSPPGATEALAVNDAAERKAEVVATKYASVPFVDVGRTPSDVPLALARELKAEHPEIDTIHLGSPHWGCAVIIEPLEQELEVNITQGTQAILWHALRTLGIEDQIPGYGRLLREF